MRSMTTFGELARPADGRLQLRFARRLAHPVDKVWRAITEPAHLAAWFPTDIVGERASGSAVRFVFRNGEGPTLDGQITVYQPPTLLELRWGEQTLRFELQADADDSTLLTFVDTFDELGTAARDAAGWHVCLDLLAYDLDAGTPPWTPGDHWQTVHPVYLERLGPDAATIGPPPTATHSSA